MLDGMASDGTGRNAGLREMTRRAVRAEVAAKALELFVDQGFEQTTVDQIAAAVGMSTRSVFRYFATKEDMAVGNMIELGHDVAAALADRPANEPPWEALRHALQVCVDSLEGEEAGLRTATMLAGTPALRTAILGKHLQWEQLLIPQVVERLDGREASRHLRAHALVSCALSCLDVAATEWTRTAGAASLGGLLDTAIGAVQE
jgi:AcrR family transcriptional regulator